MLKQRYLSSILPYLSGETTGDWPGTAYLWSSHCRVSEGDGQKDWSLEKRSVSNQNFMFHSIFGEIFEKRSDVCKKNNYVYCIVHFFVILFFWNSFGHLLGCWVTSPPKRQFKSLVWESPPNILSFREFGSLVKYSNSPSLMLGIMYWRYQMLRSCGLGKSRNESS